ncbi:hypothetical protein SASPL_115201 [Salvia splendens]|uniref:Serine/threonine-protein phosphatase 2A regulatory subunit B n=1 Tax=Salvia splendens TaxID=180675 RepID=A0A8X9A1W7_SALSN|nr:hypothetical protein SASPL_115201 [Salvia splendens]
MRLWLWQQKLNPLGHFWHLMVKRGRESQCEIGLMINFDLWLRVMIKNILNRIPRKQGKLGEGCDGGAMTLSSTNLKSNVVAGSRSGNLNAEAGLNPVVNNLLEYDPSNVKANGVIGSAPYEALPSFRDIPNSEKQTLFIRKLSLCCVVFDFTDPSKSLKEKDIKRQTLAEKVDYVTLANGKFSETATHDIVKMVSVNLFRTLSTQPRENKSIDGFDLVEDEPLVDPAWPHLQIVYEFLLRFVASPETDAKLAKRYEEHKLFRVRALVPLHKPKCVSTYHQQLSYCVTQFVEKDCKLADTVIRDLLKYWHFTSSSKEGMFLGKLEEVLEVTQPPEFQCCCREGSLSMEQQPHRESDQTKLHSHTANHLPGIGEQCKEPLESSRAEPNVRKIFSDVDPELFEERLLKHQEDEAGQEETKSRREATWKRLEDIATTNNEH